MNKYKDVLPGELIAVWKEYGFGSFLNGYLKVINPDEFLDVLKNSYFRADVSIPVFATGLGDIINLEEGKYIRTVKYRKGAFKVIPTFFNENWKHFMGFGLEKGQKIVLECDTCGWTEYLNGKRWEEGKAKIYPIKNNEIITAGAGH